MGLPLVHSLHDVCIAVRLYSHAVFGACCSDGANHGGAHGDVSGNGVFCDAGSGGGAVYGDAVYGDGAVCGVYCGAGAVYGDVCGDGDVFFDGAFDCDVGCDGAFFCNVPEAHQLEQWHAP